MAKKEESISILLPEGRVINESFLEKDVFTDEKGREATPSYKGEFAIPDDELDDVYTAVMDAAFEKWGSKAIEEDDDGDDVLAAHIVNPIHDGDKLAAARDEKGKDGSAYAGLSVIRAATIFNAGGVDAPGGIQVWDEEVKAIGPANRQQLYRGCYGVAAVTLGCYTIGKQDGVNFYLDGFQKTKDGDPLSTGKDTSKLFKAVGRKEGEGATRRRGRKG